MVRQDEEAKMGQGGLCGVTAPGVDSLPPPLSSEGVTAGNGMASEVQASLSMLLSTEGTLCQDELISKLRMVINENLELKETVAQNNLALRQQLGLVVKWSQQNEYQQQQHRQQLSEFTQQLSKLQQENVMLKASVLGSKAPEGSESKFREVDDTIRLLNTRLESSEKNLKQTHEEKEKLIAQRTRHEGDITLLKCDLTTTRSELERLQLERFELLSTASELRQQLRQAREGATAKARSLEASPVYEGMSGALGEAAFQKLKDQLKSEQDTSATLLQELHDTRNQVENLESEVQRAQEESSVLRDRCRNMQSKIDNPLVETTSPSSPTSASQDPVSAMEKKRLKEEAAMLREEVETLEAALTSERQKNTDERLALTRSHAEVNRLKKDLQEMKDRSDRDSQNDQYYEVKIKSLVEKHDEATAKLMSYEELLAAKNEELSKIKKELGQTKAKLTERNSEGETIAILRAQVEVYQGDFRAEREAREALATDREKLRDELRHLQTRNTQLVDELETYQRRHLNQGRGRDSRGTSEEPSGGGAAATAGSTGAGTLSPEAIWEKLSNTSDKKEEEKKEDELDENLFYCPKCNKSFDQYRPLEEHVNRCIDLD